ncbi:MAG TPA: sulfatase/phosphatase domain-containing protein, partial [Isosphaeraceae bacterium]|nr:sulfatase/phosphatase domain-containing protein [Isosphaeraceae bacterium]
FPSILEMSGMGVPENLALRGRSFVPLLKGESIPWDNTLFGQYDMHHGAVARLRMIRTPEWKLIRHYEPEVPDELYHLADDPEENRNLAHSEGTREVFDDLNSRLTLWMGRIGDPLISERVKSGQ